MILHSANHFFELAGNRSGAHTRRKGHLSQQVNGTVVMIRDQDPLHRGNVRLKEGWDFADLVFYLNDHVYFWPGGIYGPIAYGHRHFARYHEEDAAILRVPTRLLFDENAPSLPLFSKYNSGAPRCVQGNGSPRGSDTFSPAE